MNQPPLTFGRFQARDVLGRGGFASVFRAYDPDADRDVALKHLLVQDADAEALGAEENGARIQQALHDRGAAVPEVYESGWLGNDAFYIAMELIEAEDLSRVIARGPMAEPRVLTIADQLCHLLEIAYGLDEIDGQEADGVVHGDLKPGNIKLEPNDRVRVLDFGVAKALSTTRKFTRATAHSVAYASPERLEHDLIDHRADLWSLAVVLYELLAGQPAFAGKESQLEQQIIHGNPVPLPEGCCSPALARLLRQALAPNPAHRYATAAELGEALREVAQGEGTVGPDIDRDRTRRTSQQGGRTRHTRRTWSPDGSRSGDAGGAPRTRRSDTRRPGTDAASRTRPDMTGRSTTQPGNAKPPPPPAPPAGPQQAPAQQQPLPGPPNVSGGRVRRLVIAAATLLIILHGWVLIRAMGLRDELSNPEAAQVEAYWPRYEHLRRLDPLGIVSWPAKARVRDALVASADNLMSSYEQDLPPANLAWGTALDHLQEARGLGATGNAFRAKIHYCEGQVARVGATRDRQENRGDDAQRDFQDAVEHFNAAVELDPAWAAPHLGMASIHAYGQFDLDHLKSAIEAAAEKGYPRGNRELAQLADGHYHQCRDLRRRARDASEDRRRSFLEEALRHCRSSEIQFAQIPPSFGRTRENLKELQDLIGRVERGLASLP